MTSDRKQQPPARPALVVTGGSSGIGAELCRLAARAGWHVWIGYASGAGRARRLADEIAGRGGEAATVPLPLDDPKALRRGVAAIADHAAPVGAAVLCGSPAPDVGSFTKLTPEQLRRQLECAVTGNHTLAAELWRRCFRPQGGGHLLAVLSAAQGPQAASHMAGYVAAKGGLEALLRAAAAELGRAGLRVSVIRPGYVETPMLAAFEPRLLDRARAAAPGGRFPGPADVAAVLLHGLQHPPEPGHLAELSVDRGAPT